MAFLRVVTPAAAAALLLAVPATAPAATLVVPPCSPSLPGQETVAVQGTGFTPNQVVRLTADGQSFGTATADAAGNFQDAFFAPPFASARRMIQTFDLAGTDDAGIAATAPLKVTRVSATLPQRARPSRRVRMKVFGFRPGQVVYLHVRRGGKTRGTYRIGRAKSPCGNTSRKLRYMPLRRWSTGTYSYEFQQSRRYQADEPRIQLRIRIIRTVRPAR